MLQRREAALTVAVHGPAAIADRIAAVPGARGSCAWSQGGVGEAVPVGGGRFEPIVAVAMLFDAQERLVGWVYRTARNTLLVQRVTPPLRLGGANSGAYSYSGYEPLRAPPDARLVPCTARDFVRRGPRPSVF
jgi:hypothetical protein